jgi:hypothetical protein
MTELAEPGPPSEEPRSKYHAVHVHTFGPVAAGRATCQACGWEERVRTPEAQEPPC